MSTSFVQRSYAAGEVTPAIFGRADQVKYQTGLRRLRNFFVRRHGGVSNRPGTQWIDEAISSTGKGRIWKFVFNADQTYILWFEDQTLRIVQDGALLTVSGLAAYNGATAYVPGDLVSSGGVNYYCIANTTGNAPPNATYWYAMPSDGTYQLPTPYVTADLPTLQFSQSADVVTITHTGYAPRDLARSGATAWTLTVVSMVPSISAPGSLAVSGAAGTVAYWEATAIKSVTQEESIPSAQVGASAVPSSGAPRTLTIGAVSGAERYNIYRHDGSGVFGYVGSAIGTTFIDNGITPDYTLTPPMTRDPFTGAGNYPAVSGYYQQRKMYGNTTNDPEDLFGSRTGSFKNFTYSSPQQDSDAVQYTLAGRQVNEIRAIVEVGQLVVLTSGAEWIREGDATAPLTPTTPNLKVQTYNGCAEIAPIVIGDNLLYIQARGSIVRDFRFEQQTNGYTGRDLSVFSTHLFDGKTLVHWDYAQIPNSVASVVRSDGRLLNLTYLREQEIWGWAWYDTDGEFEDVCVIPEGDEDAVYVLVKRTINGSTKRYLERFASRQVDDIVTDAKFLDCHLTYDGNNTNGALTMTLSTGTVWTYGTTLTLTASAAYFVAGDVDKTIVLTIETTTYDAEEGWQTTSESLTLTITGYTSNTVVSCTANKDVPAAFQGLATSNWGKGASSFTGIDHLEGKTVAIFADGSVVSNGIDGSAYTVSGGVLSPALDVPAVVVHIGLPYCSDLETLDLEMVGNETLLDKHKQVNQVTVLVENSRGLWAGEPDENGDMNADDLYELEPTAPLSYNEIQQGATGKVEVNIKTRWNVHGRIFIRQRDPLPLTILTTIPSVEVGG